MANGIIYLDIDDEITSAASRIRTLEDTRVAVVLPYGSRVATSRINFRLLARDALTHEKRLSIVAGDAATRALAASAGLPVFASVGEYEGSLEGEALADRGEAAAGPESRAARERPVTAPDPDLGLLPEGEATRAGGRRRRAPELDATAALAVVAASGATTRTTTAPPAASVEGLRPLGATSTAPTVRPATVARPGGGGRSGRIPRTPFFIVAGVLALAVVVGGVAAYLLLPTAEISVVPREETVGPLSFRVDASTDATAPDLENGVVPALTVPVEVQATQTFQATGERVEETPATGIVRFDNLDPTTSNTIAKGAIVSTNGGTRFRTDRGITVPAAKLVGLTIVPSSGRVAVTAVDPGEEGNVEPNAITTVPRGEEPIFLKVTNPDETTGGKRDTFPRVTQEDVDGALAALTTSLTQTFDLRIADPNVAPGEVTVFPETATLGEPVWALDPTTLVGQEVETFDLGGTASGNVLAVDTAPVEAIAVARLGRSVMEGYALVPDSSEITVDPAVVDGAAITFPVQATARQVATLDPAAIAAEIKGLPVAAARAVLESYGTADIRVWPDWVGTIPTIDGRLVVRVEEAAP